MPRLRRLLLLGGLTFLAGVVVFFPARVAYEWFAPPAVQVAGIEGTVWRGAAAEARVPALYLRNLTWSFRPSALFRGRIGFAVAAEPASGFIEGTVGFTPGGTVHLGDVTGSMPLDLLRESVGSPGLSGGLSLLVDSLEVRDGRPVAGQATFQVADLREPRIDSGSLGGYRGVVTTAEQGLVVHYEDTDGVIDVEGRIDLSGDGRFRHSARLRPKPATPPQIRQFIATLPLAADGTDWREAVLGEGVL